MSNRFPLYSEFTLKVISHPKQSIGDRCILIHDDGTAHPLCFFPRLGLNFHVQLYSDDISGVQATSV